MIQEKTSRILVTGGAGFIGSNLTEALLQQGHRVRILDNFSSGKRENLVFDKEYPSLEIVEGDIRDLTLCQRSMKEVEYVFHQAALASVPQSVEDPLTANAVNVEGTLNVLLAARDRGVKRLIYASSCAIYGDDPSLPKREDMVPVPLSPYALQKYIGERYGRLFYQLYGLEHISLRYFNVFGPKQDPSSIYSAVIPRFIDALVHHQSPVVYGDGEQSRDFVYVDNVVQANLLAMSAKHLYGEVINIGSGNKTSLNRLLEILKDILGSNVTPIYQESRKGDIKESLADIHKGKKVLTYESRIGMEAGLKLTVEHFKRQHSQS